MSPSKKAGLPCFFTVLLQLVTQTDAFEDFINTFSVVNRVEDLVDFFLGEARSYLCICFKKWFEVYLVIP